MYDYDKAATKRRNVKYILPFIIGGLYLLSVGQILAQFVSVSQLNKESGQITYIETKIISYSHQRYGGRTPNYGLVITLNSGNYYNIENTGARAKLGTLLHIGDQVTIYYPTTLYKILTAGFTNAVNQVELGNQIVYNFDEQKQTDFWLVGAFIAFGSGFWWLRSYILRTNYWA